jgi:hypothetical protein
MLSRLLVIPVLFILTLVTILGTGLLPGYSAVPGLNELGLRLGKDVTIAESIGPELSPDALTDWYPHANMPKASLSVPDNGNLLAQASWQPRMVLRPANPTNYGPRFTQDINGNPVSNPMVVVLHETVGSGSSAINTIQASQSDESRQVSYHAIVLLDGTLAFLVPPEFRAFGAGDSVFMVANGPESVRTHPIFPPSVNNFAYHISLETPPDGRGNGSGHSGYTAAQYRSLAWLVLRTGVPENRVTTHRAVDRSGQRRDPRSFNTAQFNQLIRSARG